MSDRPAIHDHPVFGALSEPARRQVCGCDECTGDQWDASATEWRATR